VKIIVFSKQTKQFPIAANLICVHVNIYRNWLVLSYHANITINYDVLSLRI